MINGLLLVDKPAGITSHDVVDRVRRVVGQRRIGHTGTLDPGATGLLVLCLGQATRLSEYLTDLDKVYEGVMRLGIETSSYDLDGEVVAERPVPALDAEAIQAVCNGFVGDILQIPPMMSAVKVGGRRLYKIARQGEVVERQPRPVKVFSYDVLSWTPPDAGIRVRCGSGTYVRSLCHEAGLLLGCGAVLAALRRTAVGRYNVAQALSADDLGASENVDARTIPMDNALDLPAVRVDRAREAIVATGGAVLVENHEEGAASVREGLVQIKNASGRLIALGTAMPSAMGVRVQPKRVFVGQD
jgi:tRNA pseudouridine55 synthase